MVFENFFYLPTQNSSSYSSNLLSEDEVDNNSSPLIANVPNITNNHNSSSTAISIPSSLEYSKKFVLPTQDSSSVSTISSFSDYSLLIGHTKKKKKHASDAFCILQIHCLQKVQFMLRHHSTTEQKK